MDQIKRTNHCGELRITDVGKEVDLVGWVAKKRNLGSLVFIDLRDRWGIVQITIQSDKVNLIDVRNEYIIGVHVVSYIREKNVGKGFTISDNVDVSIHSNKVVYKFFVTKKNKVNPHYIENCITDYINSNLLMICEVVPFEISVKVTSEAGE